MHTHQMRHLSFAAAVAVVLAASGCSAQEIRDGSGNDRRPVAASHPGRNAPSMMAYDGALRVGEYACYGSGGDVLIGLGFIVLNGGRYTDLDRTESGTYTVNGDTVRFSGGHLDGMKGRNLDSDSGSFVMGQGASCEPW